MSKNAPISKGIFHRICHPTKQINTLFKNQKFSMTVVKKDKLLPDVKCKRTYDNIPQDTQGSISCFAFFITISQNDSFIEELEKYPAIIMNNGI